MTIIQEVKKKKKTKEKEKVLEPARKLSDARDEIIYFFEKGIFPYKDNTFKTKEKEQSEEELEEKNFLNILRMNQKVLTMICLKNILIFQHLLF